MITATLILDADNWRNLADSLRTFAMGLEFAMAGDTEILAEPVEVEVHERGVNGIFAARTAEPEPSAPIPFEAPPDTPKPTPAPW